MLQNAIRSFIYKDSNQILQNKLQFNINILTRTINCSKLISFMCKKLNKLEDVRIFNLLNNTNESYNNDSFAFNKVVP
jgi:hypothetical protein